MRIRTESEESSQIPVTMRAAEASDLPEGQEGEVAMRPESSVRINTCLPATDE